jgi:hypothetical protein
MECSIVDNLTIQTWPAFGVDVTISVHCATPKCSASESLLQQEIRPLERLPILSAPKGWNIINGHAYCPQHRITLFDVVDGTPVVLKLKS